MVPITKSICSLKHCNISRNKMNQYHSRFTHRTSGGVVEVVDRSSPESEVGVKTAS